MSQKVITCLGLLYPAELRKKNRKRKLKKEHRSTLKVVKDLTVTYLEKSSIHGLKSLVNPNHNIFQRIFSVSVVLFCLIVACINIASSYYTYQDSAHITVMKSDSLFISSIPFPGVAVCNLNRIKKSALIKMAHRMKGNANMSFAETYSILKNLYKIHDLNAVSENERALLEFILRQNGQSHKLSKIMKELSHSCDDMLKTCKLMNLLTPCKNLFKQAILPVSRSCCISKNSIITGDTNDIPIWTQVSNGVSFGVFLNLDLETNEYLPLSATLSYGAEIMIFDPRSHPYTLTFGVSSMFASYKEVTFISIDPSVDNNTYANEGDDHSVCKRSYPNKKNSNRTFHYSFSECQFRCMMSKLFKPCKCLLYKHSFEEGMQYEECSISGIQCVNDYYNRESMTKDYGVTEHDKHIILNECKCSPACESILYKSTTSTLIRDHSTNPTNETHVFIFFERSFVDLYEREPIYTTMELLVQIIGQCSLFFGGSVASIVELIYFITLRLLCELYTNQKRKKNTENETLNVDGRCTRVGEIDLNEVLADID